VDPFAEIPDIGIQVLLVVRSRYPIYSGTRLPPQPAERPLERCVVHVVQQGREADLARTSCHLIHPSEFGWQRYPALRPVSRRPSQVPRGSGSYLELARFLRRCHQTYTPIRHPVSAQPAAPVVPCHRPPSATRPKDPTGLPKFRRVPFMHEMAFDPGRAAVPRISALFVLPSSYRTDSASAMLDISWLIPIPCMIAVYASDRPLPTACLQHSLPGGSLHLTRAGLPPAGPRQLRLAHPTSPRSPLSVAL